MEFMMPASHETPLIIGFVQSGKSEIMFAMALFVARILRVNVVVALRNYVGDHQQFEYNFKNVFLEDLRGHLQNLGHDIPGEIISVLSAGNLSRSRSDHSLNDPQNIETTLMTENGSVVIALANDSQLGSLQEIVERVDRPFVMMIDEMDDTAYGSGRTHEILRILMDHSAHTIGVSATVFDPLHDQRFRASRVRILPPSDDYKGVQDFRKCIISPIPFPSTLSRLDRDPDLIRILDHLRTTTLHTSDEQHPVMMLLKNERLKRNQNDLMDDLIGRYHNDYAIIVHNSDSTTVYAPGRRLFVTGVFRRRLHEDFDRRGVYHLRRTAIQDVLQILKSQPGGNCRFSRIVIISHDIIGRGINLVSRDFQWHLTHMFYRPSTITTMPMMLQSMRLCGRFRDDLQLTLYTEQSALDTIMRGHQLQCEAVERIIQSVDDGVASAGDIPSRKDSQKECVPRKDQTDDTFPAHDRCRR